MTVEIYGSTVGQVYKEALIKIAMHGYAEDTRGGKVLTVEEPVVLTLTNPLSRVLWNPQRNANPFFHIMETVWMLAGRNDVKFLTLFNPRMAEFADNGAINGAYGYRWRNPIEQIAMVAQVLNASPNTRQAVIAMWDPDLDLGTTVNDRPCNTHIYFRILRGRLNMTVCNRSNDLIWGMLGANVVHMTYLHELVARMINKPLGEYMVFTNNLHIYERHWKLLATSYGMETHDRFPTGGVPILSPGEDYWTLVSQCGQFVKGVHIEAPVRWIREVALPARAMWYGEDTDIGDENWNLNCREWLARKSKSTGERA